jgi:AhpD family alkylhydroperoxidase
MRVVSVVFVVFATLQVAHSLEKARSNLNFRPENLLNSKHALKQQQATNLGRSTVHPILRADASLRLNGGAAKKTFSLGSCLQDHFTIMSWIPAIFDAYAGPNRIDPATNEAIMLAVNSVNDCPYCSGIHGELSRMAGLGLDSSKKSSSKSSKEAMDAAMIAYAKDFGRCNGRGECLSKKYAELETKIGKGNAASVQALCWFLHWGSISGNTLLSLYRGRLTGNPKPGSNILFEILFAAYYTPLYLVISATTLLFKAFPARVPKLLSMAIGCTLTTVASVWIVPIGLLGFITSPFRRGVVAIN